MTTSKLNISLIASDFLAFTLLSDISSHHEELKP